MAPHKKQKIALHIVACCIILILPVVDAPSPYPNKILLLNNPFVDIDFVLHAFILAFGYLNFFILIPRFFHRSYKLQYIFFVLLYFLMLCLLLWVSAQFGGLNLYGEHDNAPIHLVIQLRHVFFLFATVFLFSLMTWSEQRRRETENAVATADMRYLKAQVNPHFLFNSLNSIYAQIQINPQQAAVSLERMSRIMRYIIQSAENNEEDLAVAIKYLEDYMELQKDRFQDTVEIDYQNNIKDNNLKIAPLLMIPFVENAFKYGIHSVDNSVIHIHLDLEENLFTLLVKNVDYSSEIVVAKSTNIGIENTKKRLSIIYPHQHKLQIEKKSGLFTVFLQIRL